MRRGIHYGREGQLAAEGAVSLAYSWSRHMFSELVKAGREWEEETAMPSRRRRVPFDDEHGLTTRRAAPRSVAAHPNLALAADRPAAA